jgi:hypothetical protein
VNLWKKGEFQPTGVSLTPLFRAEKKIIKQMGFSPEQHQNSTRKKDNRRLKTEVGQLKESAIFNCIYQQLSMQTSRLKPLLT